MSWKIIIHFLSIVSLLFLCSCSSANLNATNQEEAFITLVNPGEDCNQTIKFVELPGFEEIKPGQFGWITLDITSQTTIWFEGDLNLRLLIFSEAANKWIEVEDEMHSSPKSFVITGREDIVGDRDVLFIVNLPLEIPASTLRVYVEGEVMKNEQPSGQKVSAFIDLPIKY